MLPCFVACSVIAPAGLDPVKCLTQEDQQTCLGFNTVMPSVDPCTRWQCIIGQNCALAPLDGDLDGSPKAECTPAGFTPDCDDEQAWNAPGATEICDGRDNNCDGMADEGVTASEQVSSVAKVDFTGMASDAFIVDQPDEVRTAELTRQYTYSPGALPVEFTADLIVGENAKIDGFRNAGGTIVQCGDANSVTIDGDVHCIEGYRETIDFSGDSHNCNMATDVQSTLAGQPPVRLVGLGASALKVSSQGPVYATLQSDKIVIKLLERSETIELSHAPVDKSGDLDLAFNQDGTKLLIAYKSGCGSSTIKILVAENINGSWQLSEVVTESNNEQKPSVVFHENEFAVASAKVIGPRYQVFLRRVDASFKVIYSEALSGMGDFELPLFVRLSVGANKRYKVDFISSGAWARAEAICRVPNM